jgi:hypothetical protein
VVRVDDVVADLELAYVRGEVLEVLDPLDAGLLDCYLCDVRLLK